jgi:hypothetical protein
LLAIDEFNGAHDHRRLDPIRILRYRRPFDRELWLERMYALHVLDHPLRAAPSGRSGLSIAEHREAAIYDWPL